MSYRIIKKCGCGKSYNRKTWRSTLAIVVSRAVTLKALGALRASGLRRYP